MIDLVEVQFTFQVLGVFREIDIPRPPNEPLIRPDQRICVNLLALMSPDSESLLQKHDVISLTVLFNRNYIRSIKLHRKLINQLVFSHIPDELGKIL